MSIDIKIRRGFNLNLNGEANKILSESERSKTYALRPEDFFCLKPKLLVKEGDKVKKGTPLFFSKKNPILFSNLFQKAFFLKKMIS